MEKLNTTQKKVVKDFIDSTQASENQALGVLKTNNWKVDRAINYWYDHDMKPEKPKVSNEAIALYQQYKSQEGDYIYENTGQFMQDCGVNPSDIMCFYMCKLLGSKEDFTLDRQGFTEGVSALGCKSTTDIKKIVGKLRNDMMQNFQEFYQWVGRYVCGAIQETKRKFIPGINKETQQSITATLRLLLATQKCDFLEQLIQFLDEQIKNNPNFQISLDSWDMTYIFVKEMKGDLQNYDEMGAWPALIDDFMEYINKNKN